MQQKYLENRNDSMIICLENKIVKPCQPAELQIIMTDAEILRNLLKGFLLKEDNEFTASGDRWVRVKTRKIKIIPGG